MAAMQGLQVPTQSPPTGFEFAKAAEVKQNVMRKIRKVGFMGFGNDGS